MYGPGLCKRAPDIPYDISYDDIESQKVEKNKQSYVRVHFQPKKVI